MHIWFVLGTAAELIKVYPLLRGAEERGWLWRVLVTGQSGKNFWLQWDDFSLPRDKALTVVASAEDLHHSAQAGRWLVRAWFASLSAIKIAVDPNARNWIVVHGDTLSTVVGTHWSRRLHWPLAHVEAGLRSKHWWQPFPEELNRRWVSRYADLHFAPDALAAGHLARAGVKGRIINTQGNSLRDAVRLVGLARPDLRSERPLVVANLHRYENLNSSRRWGRLVATLVEAAAKYRVILVLHPQTQHKLEQDEAASLQLKAAGVETRPRMMFKEFLALVASAELLITDGGSNQEECYYLGKPCLVMRQTTERQEGLGTTTVLSHLDPKLISEFLHSPQRHAHPPAFGEQSPSRIMLDELAASAAQGTAP